MAATGRWTAKALIAAAVLAASPAAIADGIWVDQVGASGARSAATSGSRGVRMSALGDTNVNTLVVSDGVTGLVKQAGLGNWIVGTLGGTANEVAVTQTGMQNGIGLTLDGTGNRLTVDQTGMSNSLTISQTGERLVLSATQSGTGNQMTLQQSGVGSTLVAVQSGMANQLGAAQSGAGNRLVAIQR